jgi:hypothetical protein
MHMTKACTNRDCKEYGKKVEILHPLQSQFLYCESCLVGKVEVKIEQPIADELVKEEKEEILVPAQFDIQKIFNRP